MANEALETDYATIEDLIRTEVDECRRSVHIECTRETCIRAFNAIRALNRPCRAAYFLEGDGGFDRDTPRSYLRFFAQLADRSRADAEEALVRFGLAELGRTAIAKLSPEHRTLLEFARMSLSDPDICFCERPLLELGSESRALVLAWISERSSSTAGTSFVTVGEPLREALLMPGRAFWEDEGRLFAADLDDEDEDAPSDLPDEVRVCKISVRAGSSTLLLDPRDIDFIESSNRVNYASVRGELYPTMRNMDELESELERFGFFRCHRSYIVNVQKVARVDRYTRNTFNLVLSDASHTSLPLSKGRAEQMRERFGWK